MTATATPATATIPATGLSREQVQEALARLSERDLPWGDGHAFGYIYCAGREATEVGKEAFMRFMHTNALDPTVCPSTLQLEREVVQMAIAHLRGDDSVVGSFSSGGTESIMLAVKTARDHARATRPEVTRPQMILPITAHAAFHKAAHYLDVEVVPVPVSPDTFRADVEAMREAITDRTILLVGSASGYTHGVLDPIAELGALAQEHGLLLHVDGCIGGFLLPWFRKLGEDVPDFDFEVPGVTSISMDLHKYGFAPKGASVILYRHRDLREHQIYACARWTGYSVVNPTVQSTKSAGPLAGAWAVMRFLGEDGYLDLARGILEAKRTLVAGIEKIDGLRVLGDPEMSLIGIAWDKGCVFELAETMRARGWYLQAQPSFESCPKNLHLLIGPDNAAFAEAMLKDLRACVAAAPAAAQEAGPEAAVAGMLSALDPKDIDDATYAQLLGAAGLEGTELPERMVEVNRILDALPPQWTEWLLVRYMNELFA